MLLASDSWRSETNCEIALNSASINDSPHCSDQSNSSYDTVMTRLARVDQVGGDHEKLLMGNTRIATKAIHTFLKEVGLDGEHSVEGTRR